MLTVTQMLRKKGVVDKFVEFYGPGLDDLSLADRATIANMAPEYGATCGFFPVDAETLRYLKATGRDAGAHRAGRGLRQGAGHVARRQDARPGVHRHAGARHLARSSPSLAGPKRPQDRVPLTEAAAELQEGADRDLRPPRRHESRVSVEGANYDLGDGDVVIAAITCCTNTSNPSVHARRRPGRAQRGEARPQVQAVGEDLAGAGLAGGDRLSEEAGLQTYLDKLGFNLVGYGCTTCIGNSGPLPDPIADAITHGDLVAAAVLSGNRNFEGRVNPHVKANYLASPPLVVAYALAGSMKIDITKDPLGYGKNGKPVYLKDIWPTQRGDRRRGAQVRDAGDVQEALRRRLRRRRSCGRR